MKIKFNGSATGRQCRSRGLYCSYGAACEHKENTAEGCTVHMGQWEARLVNTRRTHRQNCDVWGRGCDTALVNAHASPEDDSDDITRFFTICTPHQMSLGYLTHCGRVTQICVLHYNCARRMTQICVFNMPFVSTHYTLNYAMVLLTDVHRNVTSLRVNGL